MRRRALLALIVTAALTSTSAIAATGATAQVERTRWDTRVLSLVPSPGFPAFVHAHPNGRIYAGTYTDPTGDQMPSRVMEWTGDGTLLRSWTVPGQDLERPHGVQVAISDALGRLVLLEKSRPRVLMLDVRTGRFTPYATFRDLATCGPTLGEGCSPNAVDKPAIPNFAAWGPHGELYVTDYGQAVLWRVPPGGGRAEIWLADRRLDGMEFGTTGLLLTPDRKALLVAQQTSAGLGEPNPTTGRLYRVPIRRSQPGALRSVWESRPGDLPDGFGIGRSGAVYMSTAGLSAQIVVIGPDGEEVERFPQTPATGDNGSEVPFDTPSSATFRGRRILVANQAYSGRAENHAILDVFVGERGVPVFVPDGAGS